MHVPTTEQNDAERVLREKHQELADLMQAIAAEETDIDLKIAAIVEGESEAVKLSIVAHIRDMIRAREEEQARQMQQLACDQEREMAEQQRRGLRMWLAFLMSEATLKKIKLAALIPLLRQQGVKDIGQALAERGVTLNPNVTDRRELGQLSNTLAQAKDKEKDVGRGR